MLKTTANAVPMGEFYKRLQEKLGISYVLTKEVHKAYKELYLELVKEGRSIQLPGIGFYELRPWKDPFVYYPKLKAKGPRTSKFQVVVTQSKKVKQILRGKDGTV